MIYSQHFHHWEQGMAPQLQPPVRELQSEVPPEPPQLLLRLLLFAHSFALFGLNLNYLHSSKQSPSKEGGTLSCEGGNRI